MLRKFAIAFGLAAIVAAGAVGTTSEAQAGWRGDRTVVVQRGHSHHAHYRGRAHRHGCVVKRTVRFTPRGKVKVVKRVCR